jgi:murein DD-endopeptidase MepM/ murein hydrolase activator NlpD
VIRFAIRARRGAVLSSAALLAVLATAALPAVAVAAPPPAPDAGVTSAAGQLTAAQARVEHLGTALDKTAEQYEQANAHRIRLQDELVEADALLRRASDAVTAAEDQLGSRVADVYKHPRGGSSLTGAMLESPDAPSALHVAALYRRLVAQSAASVDQAAWTSELTRSDVRAEHVIAAGAEASVHEWKRQSVALTDALAVAKRDLASAEDGLAAARAEAARQAAERARVEALLQTGAAPGAVPSIDGRTCPVGGPNGFIDSWGFPRSGGRTHEGVDMFAPYGTPIYAVADGEVYRVYNNTIGGLSINLIDQAGNMYYYTHLSSTSVETGQKVRMGQVMGAVGTSGNAAGTPPHLHWQFHPGNGEPVNPYPLAYALCR